MVGNFPSRPFSSLKKPPLCTSRACWGVDGGSNGYRRTAGGYEYIFNCRYLRLLSWHLFRNEAEATSYSAGTRCKSCRAEQRDPAAG